MYLSPRPLIDDGLGNVAKKLQKAIQKGNVAKIQKLQQKAEKKFQKLQVKAEKRAAKGKSADKQLKKASEILEAYKASQAVLQPAQAVAQPSSEVLPGTVSPQTQIQPAYYNLPALVGAPGAITAYGGEQGYGTMTPTPSAPVNVSITGPDQAGVAPPGSLPPWAIPALAGGVALMLLMKKGR